MQNNFFHYFFLETIERFYLICEKEKLQDFEHFVKEQVFEEKPSIVLQSSDPDDCINRMHKAVDKNAERFVAGDDFLKKVPEKELAQIKKDLEDPFRNAYESKDVP